MYEKIITILLIIAIMVINLVGCGAVQNEEFGDNERFKIVERYDTNTQIAPGYPVYIFVDTYTNVMYLQIGAKGTTTLFNSDGTLMLWEGE